MADKAKIQKSPAPDPASADTAPIDPRILAIARVLGRQAAREQFRSFGPIKNIRSPLPR